MTTINANIEQVVINADVCQTQIKASTEEVTISAKIADSMIINNAPFNPTQAEWDNFVLTIMS